MYDEDNLLMLSGIQHFSFCPRQWALIHMDGYWKDNVLTTQGSLLHSRVDDPSIRQCLNNNITLRHVSITSFELGLYGITDAIELIPSFNARGVTHPKFPGFFLPYPVEYKRGRQKSNMCDKLQLVAQAICLEEMYNVSIPKGALFYWEVKRREEEESLQLTDEGRKVIISAWQERKKQEITHPFLEEKIPIGLLAYAQALLMARFIRGDLDSYPVFLLK